MKRHRPTAPIWTALLITGSVACQASSETDSPAAAGPAGYDLSSGTVERHTLPRSLAEVSGLAVDSEGRLFAHDDEVAIVYELDPGTGAEVRRFGVGEPTARADFEGIAAMGSELYLVTSAGSLLTFRPGQDRQSVPFQRVQTGIGSRCEIEGLAEDPNRARLLVACKQPRSADLAERVTVFAVDPAESENPVPELVLSVPWEKIRAAGGSRAFHPSGLAVAPDGERLFIISARQRALLEVAWSGEVLGIHSLGRWHLQPEGIAFGADGTLLISDEGAGGRPRLSRYRFSLKPEK